MFRASLIVLASLALLLVSENASAYCRSTTCRSTGGKECPTDEDGCPTSGEPLYWPTKCLTYAVNKLGTQDLDPEDTRAVIKKTFQHWSDVECPNGETASMTFQEREPVPCKKSQYNKTGNNLNVILFQDDDWKYRGIDGTLAKTSVTYNDETGEIYDADIEVNTANNFVTITDDPNKIQYDLEAIMTHEVGHFIGIAHSPDPGAVMFASYSPGSTTQRKLHPDDIKAVCGIYPPGIDLDCDLEPRGGFSPRCDDPDTGGICSVGSLGSSEASFGVMGLVFGSGILAAAGIRRRARSLSALGRSK